MNRCFLSPGPYIIPSVGQVNGQLLNVARCDFVACFEKSEIKKFFACRVPLSPKTFIHAQDPLTTSDSLRRNMVYNVSAATLSVRRRLEWRPSESDVKMCILKGKSEAACHNYIRVIAKKAHDRVLVCGTNAYKPKCRDYALLPSGPPPSGGSSFADQRQKNQRGSDREFSLTEEKPGEGLCPYDPNHNSTFTFAGTLVVGRWSRLVMMMMIMINYC